MTRDFFLKTNRIGFSEWRQDDIKLAELLWGDKEVTKFICASGQFSEKDIAMRLEKEIETNAKHHIQYWPIFELESNELIGCCGLRPYSENKYEIGFHLRPMFWRQGYAVEAANAVIDYAFSVLRTEGLFAGHNPNNVASKKVLEKLGFSYVRDEVYEPTGLYHPSYELKPKIDIYGENRFSQHTKMREACRGIVILDEKILLSYEVNADQWFIPGGGLEQNESLEECCMRELAEETGYLVKPNQRFLTINEYYEEWLFVSHYFVCEVVGKTERSLTEREAEVGLEPRWISLDDAIEMYSKHQDYADGNEMKRGAYLREYEALKYFVQVR